MKQRVTLGVLSLVYLKLESGDTPFIYSPFPSHVMDKSYNFPRDIHVGGLIPVTGLPFPTKAKGGGPKSSKCTTNCLLGTSVK